MGMQNKSEVIIIFSIGWYNKYAYTQLELRFQRRLFSHPLYGTVINMIFTLLAAIIAHIPVGQKQHKQERTAGAIQSRYWARLTTVGATPGCLTCTKINTKLDVLIDANNYSQKLSIQ